MAKVHHNTLKKAASHKIELLVEDNEVVAVHKGVRLASGLQGNKVLEDAIAKLIAQHPVTQKVATSTDKTTARAATKAIAKAPKAPVIKTPAQEAAEEEGWKALRGGGFTKKEEGEESENSDVATWEELCEEQGIELPEVEENEEEERHSIVKDKYKKVYAQTAVKGTCGDDLAAQLREYLITETEDGPRVDRKKLQKWAEANGIWMPAYRSMKSGMAAMNTRNRLRAKMRKAEAAGEVFEIQWP